MARRVLHEALSAENINSQVPVQILSRTQWRAVRDEARHLRFEGLDKKLGITDEKRLSENDDLPGVVHAAAFQDGKMVSTVRLDPRGSTETFMVRRMVTDPAYRGLGFGSLLLTAAEEEAIARGAQQFMLYARPEAVDFYKQQGYGAPTGLMEEHDGQQNIVMTKWVS